MVGAIQDQGEDILSSTAQSEPSVHLTLGGSWVVARPRHLPCCVCLGKSLPLPVSGKTYFPHLYHKVSSSYTIPNAFLGPTSCSCSHRPVPSKSADKEGPLPGDSPTLLCQESPPHLHTPPRMNYCLHPPPLPHPTRHLAASIA